MPNKDSNIDIDKIVKHWIETSNEDFNTMLSLFESKSYNWALFVGHISVEKLLKAKHIKTHGQHAPFTHNLYRLAELCKIELTEEQSDWLDKVTSFNLNAKYNDFNKEFYKQCTAEFTEFWIGKIKILRSWISQML